MAYCAKCGGELGEDTYFCPNCGARTPKGTDEGVEPHWRKELDKALQTASRNLDEGLKEARRNLEEVARELGPELEQAKEGIKEAAEDVGDGIRGAADRLKSRTERTHVYCPSCGRKNDEKATFCIDCGEKIA